ncbi:MAG: 1-acyl-sn-glycerol-3-phosphate acyltransferase [Deltaproteobacteria bacterium]|nr:MAG: 1-acyl-sn-glycerol-3-phosphate acyltransferase [Deltaproteobacteria bacterium]
MAAVMASAAGHLCLYRLSALVWGRSPGRALLLFRHWGRRTWDWLGVDVELHGTPPSRPCLYVANHRSYLDIPILAGVLGASFLSRADVAGWWVIGGAARAIDTVFVDREDPRARMRAARALARRLRTVTIRYGDRQAYWTDDLALSAHLRRLVLGRRNARAAVHIGRPLGAEAHRDGQSLAGAAYRAVCGPIEAFGELVSEAVSPVRP